MPWTWTWTWTLTLTSSRIDLFAHLGLVRYADDFVVMARWLGPRIRQWLEKKLEEDLVSFSCASIQTTVYDNVHDHVDVHVRTGYFLTAPGFFARMDSRPERIPSIFEEKPSQSSFESFSPASLRPVIFPHREASASDLA